MKRTIMAGTAALSVLLSGQALAQTVEVEIAPEQRTRIKEYVVKERVAPVRVQERISVGAVLPADVELRTVPSEWARGVRGIATSIATTACIWSSRPAARSCGSSTDQKTQRAQSGVPHD